jgi:hypothetical protein
LVVVVVVVVFGFSLLFPSPFSRAGGSQQEQQDVM